MSRLLFIEFIFKRGHYPKVTPADLIKHGKIIAEARALWAKRCEEYIAKNGDRGTCVLGAGIGVPNFVPPHCRLPRTEPLIGAGSVCRAQGSLVWEDSVEEVLALLRPTFPEVFYICGRMD